MQNLASSCASNKVVGFVSNPPSNTIQWVSFSTVKASDINSFGTSTQAANSQQILSVSSSGHLEYFYVKGPFNMADFGNLKKSSIHGSRVSSAIAQAIAAVGGSGYANMLTMTMPVSAKPSPSPAPSPQPSFVGSIPLGVSLQSLFVPMCGGKPNWLSIGIYAILTVLLLIIWWVWIRR